MKLAATAILLCLLACGSSKESPQPAPAPVRAAPGKPAPVRPAPDEHPRGERIFLGACDASGAVPLSSRHVVVADDEDNVLRIYDATRGGKPLAQTDVSVALGLPRKGKKKIKFPEVDLEAATRIGNRAFWLASHGRNKKGKLAPARLRLFATSTIGDDFEIELVGHVYERLVDDLAAAPDLARFDLAEAARKAPKAPGGLSIEGLTAAPDGSVWLAFRNPVPQGRALLVPLLNLNDLIATENGGPARFGKPVLLDLGGRGVRSLSWWHGRYLIVAGPYAGGGVSVLYTWDGKDQPREVSSTDLSRYNPEGFFTPEQRDALLILSDDGERIVDGRPCKKLKDPSRKQFRGLWLTLKG